ncbi:MAG: SulP family inorganic anion transporter, partial [Alphaproteobacteria bacterium]|nr:SulP family inorganic anion transporter [Alphaproteobacteria bacterium]
MFANLRNEKRPPYTRGILLADLRASLSLAASNVPTLMALGVISGMGALAGLWCGVIVGIIAAVFGGTRAVVSGASAVLAVITATLLTGNEFTLPELAVIVVMAGAIQIALGLAGVGRFVSYMPHIVLAGFMSGIGVLLLATQVEKLIRLGMTDVAIAAVCLALLLVWPARVGRFLPAALAVIA